MLLVAQCDAMAVNTIIPRAAMLSSLRSSIHFCQILMIDCLIWDRKVATGDLRGLA